MKKILCSKDLVFLRFRLRDMSKYSIRRSSITCHSFNLLPSYQSLALDILLHITICINTKLCTNTCIRVQEIMLSLLKTSILIQKNKTFPRTLSSMWKIFYTITTPLLQTRLLTSSPAMTSSNTGTMIWRFKSYAKAYRVSNPLKIYHLGMTRL